MSTMDRYKLNRNDNQGPDLPIAGRRPKRRDAHAKADIAIAAVADPNPSFKGERQRVAINTTIDVLENEFSRGRITVAAYLSMSEYQRMLERFSGRASGGGQWMEGSRIDPVLARELAVIRNIDNARKALDVQSDVSRVFGQMGCQIVKWALLERIDFEGITNRVYGENANERRVYYIAETFRNCCENLSIHWAARGVEKRD